MPILPPGSEAPIGYTVGDLCSDSLIEIGALSPGEPADPDELQWAFRKLNYLIDTWQGLRTKVFSYQFVVFNLQANLSPHTIGNSPGATFDTSPGVRPVRLESCALILNTAGTAVDLPMNIRDKDWWALNQVKQIETSIPTDVYYDPSYPNGTLNFWPVPNVSYPVRLQWWQSVAQFDLITDPVGGPGGPNTLPPAYRNALMLTLAETLLPGAKLPPNPVLSAAALQARAAVDEQ